MSSSVSPSLWRQCSSFSLENARSIYDKLLATNLSWIKNPVFGSCVTNKWWFNFCIGQQESYNPQVKCYKCNQWLNFYTCHHRNKSSLCEHLPRPAWFSAMFLFFFPVKFPVTSDFSSRRLHVSCLKGWAYWRMKNRGPYGICQQRSSILFNDNKGYVCR